MVETARTPEPTAVGQACRAAVRRAEGLCEPCLAQCRIAWRSDGNSTRLGGLVESWQNRPQCASSSPCGGISATRKGCAIGGLGLDAEGGPKLDADHQKGKADFLDSVRQPLRGVFLNVLHKNLPEERALRESTRRVRQSEYLAARRAREAQRAAEREERLQRIFDGRDDGIVVLEENEEGRKVVLVGGYRRGKKEGLWAKYVENKLNTTTDYVSGLEHGYVVAYRAVLNQEEAPTMIGEVRNGKKHGYHWVLPRYKRRLRGRDTGVLDGIRVGAFDRPRVQ